MRRSRRSGRIRRTHITLPVTAAGSSRCRIGPTVRSGSKRSHVPRTNRARASFISRIRIIRAAALPGAMPSKRFSLCFRQTVCSCSMKRTPTTCRRRNGCPQRTTRASCACARSPKRTDSRARASRTRSPRPRRASLSGKSVYSTALIGRHKIGALAALADGDAFVANVARETERGRAEYEALARGLGLATLASRTNFVCFDLGSRDRAEAMVAELLRRGVFVRKPGAAPLDGHVRVTVGTPQERERFAGIFRAALASLAAGRERASVT